VTANAFTEDDASVVSGAVAATYATADEEGGVLTVSFTGASNAGGYYALDTANGQVTLTATGAAWVNAGNALPAVSLTVTDAGALTGTGSDTPVVTLVNDAP